MDTLSPSFKAAARPKAQKGGTSGASTQSAKRPFKLHKEAAALQGYIRCSGGLALQESCPTGQVFFAKDGNCTGYMPVAAGTSRSAPQGCRSVECACQGRADGIYTHPINKKEAIICSLQVAHPFNCPSGFVPQADKGCVGFNVTRAANNTSTRNSWSLTQP